MEPDPCALLQRLGLGEREPWERDWRRRLAALPPLPGPLPHPSLLWALMLPLLSRLELSLDSAGAERRPLIALNGPVGAGKSSLGRCLETLAAAIGVRLVAASIDDFYLPWGQRQEVMAGNPFAVDRVPPGSHDLPLMLEALGGWRAGQPLRLPRFDKRLASGRGDRAGWRMEVADAVLIEGWLMGCRSLPEAVVAESSQPEVLPGLTPEERGWLPFWNARLRDYEAVWGLCDGLWVLRPLDWRFPRRWRLQAEARQRRAGGGWLPAGSIDALVRASLHSLPPCLYQDPLLPGLDPAVEAVAFLDGRRRCRRLEPSHQASPQASPSSLSSAMG